MTDIALLLDPRQENSIDAEDVKERISEQKATVVSLQVPEVVEGSLDPDEFLTCYYQHGVNLSNVGEGFKLRDIILVKTPNNESPLNFVLLHVWNWPESTYDIDSVRVPYQGETDPRNNPKGKNPGNVWAFSEQLNDRQPGTQAQLFEPNPPDTVSDGHIEYEAVERIIKCHSSSGDTVHILAEESDVAAIESIATELDRDATEIPRGSPDTKDKIPVMVDELPVDQTEKNDDLDSLPDELDVSGKGINYKICDCREGLQHLPEEIIQDVVTSPPYNIAYDPFNVPKPDPVTGEVRSPLREGYEDEMPAEKYHSLLQSTFEEIDKKMDPTSADAFVNIKNNYNGGDCRPPFWLLELIPDDWQFADLLVWRYDISYDPAKNKYKPYYEWIFRFSKGATNTDGGSDFLKDYYIPIVKGNSSEREGLVHPAMYPKQLVKTCLEVSDHSGLVVDPFLGSGTTLAAAKELGRPAIGFEKNRKFEDDIKKRVRRAHSPRLE